MLSDVLFPASRSGIKVLLNFYSVQFTDNSCMQFASEVSPWWWQGCYCESSGIPSFSFNSSIIIYYSFVNLHFLIFCQILQKTPKDKKANLVIHGFVDKVPYKKNQLKPNGLKYINFNTM